MERFKYIALTRDVSDSLPRCELTFLERDAIDLARARAQHAAYRAALEDLGVQFIRLSAQHELPDAVFLEDCAVVVHELAVITSMGSMSREPEATTLAPKLAEFRSLQFMEGPARLDGGDVLRIGCDLYVGQSRRTTTEGVSQLRQILEPLGYRIIPIPVTGCLHLKTAASFIGRNSVLVNSRCIDPKYFEGKEVFHVSDDEPWAANALCLNGQVLYPANYPKTRKSLERAGFMVRCIDISEFHKAEAGVTCLSIVFENTQVSYSSASNSSAMPDAQELST